jgi:hypothetical protein
VVSTYHILERDSRLTAAMSAVALAAAVADRSAKGRAGKGLGCNSAEHLALAVAAIRVCSSSVRGAEMMGPELARVACRFPA